MHSSNVGTIGDSPCLGNVCRTPADLGNLVGFCNQTFLQYGCKKGIYLILRMYAGFLLQIWENLVGVWQSCILGKLG